MRNFEQHVTRISPAVRLRSVVVGFAAVILTLIPQRVAAHEEQTHCGFNEATPTGIQFSASSGLSMSFGQSGDPGLSYVVEGARSLVLTWQAAGAYSLTIDFRRDLFEMAGSDRLQMDVFVAEGGELPSGITLTHPLIGQVSARGSVLDDRWNLICFRTEDIVNDGVGGEFVLSFTVNGHGSMALDNFRRTSLIPVIHRASGHEKRCDLRWAPLWSNSGASYIVYRALSGTGQFAALTPPADAYGVYHKFPAYSDFDVANGTAYDYRVEALVNGNTYLSDIVTITPKAETDEEFLAGVGIATGFSYWQTAYPYSGMGVFNGPSLFPGSSQSGGMGFSMTSLPVLVERGYISREAAAERVRLVMRFLHYLRTGMKASTAC